MTNALKVTLLIIDHDGVGERVKDIIEEQKFPNRCISPWVMDVESVDLGEWRDSHPLNFASSKKEEFEELFPTDRRDVEDSLALLSIIGPPAETLKEKLQALMARLSDSDHELVRVRERARTAAQTLIAEIGSDGGPEDCDEAAARAATVIAGLKQSFAEEQQNRVDAEAEARSLKLAAEVDAKIIADLQARLKEVT
jgi:hypothetical protein